MLSPLQPGSSIILIKWERVMSEAGKLISGQWNKSLSFSWFQANPEPGLIITESVRDPEFKPVCGNYNVINCTSVKLTSGAMRAYLSQDPRSRFT